MSMIANINPPVIACIRLASQQLTETKFTTPKEIVAWMGGIQSQDYPMAKWAVGVRLPGVKDQSIEAAINRAEIIRTHLLRPTWHFVAAEDIYWLLDLTAKQVKAAQMSRDRDLELTETVFSKSNAIFANALDSGKQLSREALVAQLNSAGIATDQNRASHLLARAELEKIICSGEIRKGKPTYALLSERVPQTRGLTREEALAELAKRFFTSRCPATLQDFTWWSGLTAGEARQALELVKSSFHAEKSGERTYWFPENFSLPGQMDKVVNLLPAYDEFTLSYTDRSASIPADLDRHLKAISDRGIFRPIIVFNGQIIGVWKRTIKKNDVLVEIQLFNDADRPKMSMIESVIDNYGNFIDKNVIVKA